jgi:hypothetical protein
MLLEEKSPIPRAKKALLAVVKTDGQQSLNEDQV